MSHRTICPAVIFAPKRKLNVKGRTIILIVSIKTRKGFNHAGPPEGRRLAVIVVKL